jgi:ferredoxin-type protein NapG
MAEPISRRQLFRFKLGDFTRHFKEEDNEEAPPEKKWIRPPGAIADENSFLTSCERCPHCADACPHHAISLLGPGEGNKEGSPVLNPAQSPCHWCVDMPCIQACPTDALTYPIENDVSSLRPIAIARIDHDACLLAQGILCDTCATRCPTHIRAIRMNGRHPVLDATRCTGCGLCAYHCDGEPGAINVLPR